MSPQFNNMSELLSYLESLENRLKTIENENRVLMDQKEFLTKYINGLDRDDKVVLPRTNIVSPRYLTRAFAVWGHYFVANLIISVPITAVIIAAYLLMLYGVIPNFLAMPWEPIAPPPWCPLVVDAGTTRS